MDALRRVSFEPGKRNDPAVRDCSNEPDRGVDAPMISDGDEANAERLALVQNGRVVIILGGESRRRLVTTLIGVGVHLQGGPDPVRSDGRASHQASPARPQATAVCMSKSTESS